MIENIEMRFDRRRLPDPAALPAAVAAATKQVPLRWYVSRVTDQELVVEATLAQGTPRQVIPRDVLRVNRSRSVVVSVIPTGVGCSVGGYAGDAAPASRLLAATADYLVTNPNAVNASNFISLHDNLLYCEGSAIDELMAGTTNLYVPYANRVGLVVEQAEEAVIDQIFNVVNAVRAVHGIDVVHCVVTRERIGTRCLRNAAGAFVGTVDRPDVLFAACDELIERGADAIAIASNVQDLPMDAYAEHFSGACPNPVGGVEAVVSHLVVGRHRVPAAHAPMVNLKEMELDDDVVDARGAGEMASWSGLACVLIGLARAPRLEARGRVRDVIGVENVVAVVAPAGCLGGPPVLYAQQHGIPVVAVAANETILDVTAERLGLRDVIQVANYAEAAGVLMALSQGISLDTLYRPLTTLRPVRVPALVPAAVAG